MATRNKSGGHILLLYVVKSIGFLGEHTGCIPALLGVGGCQANADSFLINFKP